jgi:hypothetical protein
MDNKPRLRGKQGNGQKKSACCNKKQSAHREGSLGMFIGSQLCQVSNGKEDLPEATDLKSKCASKGIRVESQ